jgi:hypothetical protein
MAEVERATKSFGRNAERLIKAKRQPELRRGLGTIIATLWLTAVPIASAVAQGVVARRRAALGHSSGRRFAPRSRKSAQRCFLRQFDDIQIGVNLLRFQSTRPADLEQS